MNRTILITLGSVFALGACSASRPASPEEADDIAQAITATVAAGGGVGEVAAMTDVVKLARGAMPGGLARTSDGRIGGRRLDLDVSYELVCKDAAGNTLARCDARTDQATIDLVRSGSLDTPSFDATSNGIGTWSLTGLQTDTATLSGLSAFSSSATLTPILRAGVTATYELDTAAAYNAIQIDTASHEIIDGSAIFDVSARHTVTGGRTDVDESFEAHVELTFEGDSLATLVVDGTRRYVSHLGTGLVVHDRGR